MKLLGLAITTLLMVPAAAAAQAPVLKTVGQKDRRVVVTFSAPHAGGVTVYIAKAPQQNSDGSFVTANLADVGVLTSDQIAAGAWTEQTQLVPGRYWVMVGANPDQTCVQGDGSVSASCASGDSRVASVTVSPPPTRYRATIVPAQSSSGSVLLRLTATPLGVRRTARLCYPITVRNRSSTNCVNQRLAGVSWIGSVNSQVRLSTRGMSKHESFTWSVSGHTVARLTARIP